MHTLVSALLLLVTPFVHAETPGPFVVAIEPGKTAEQATAGEGTTLYGDPAVPLLRNVTSPTLTGWLPDPDRASGAAVIVAPGGAYVMLAIEHEGNDVARWLAARGIAAFVLKYRLAAMPATDAGFKKERDRQMQHPELLRPLIDGQVPIAAADGRAAVRYLRRRAADWGLDPRRIGILGFSAGGGVAIGSVSRYTAQQRPDFAAIIYGAGRVDDVPGDAPPLFIVAASDDPVVPAATSADLYRRWQETGHTAELHLYARGGHGFGMLQQGLPADHWIDVFYAWLQSEQLVPATD